MYKNNDFIYDATVRLEELTNSPVQFTSGRKEYDAIITFKKQSFTVEARSEIRASNKGIVLSEIDAIKEKTNRPVILAARYIAQEIAIELRELGINYIDIAGNAHINEGEIFVLISGQKTQYQEKTNQARAFQEAGIKLIFNLLNNPENLQLSYRELAELANISIGSVSNIMQELEGMNFILKTSSKRILKNTPDLLNRWIIAYGDILRPRILKKRMRFTDKDHSSNWRTLEIQELEFNNLWGCEPAAAILTRQFSPAKYTIYTDGNWQSISRELKLIPDEDGEIEILQIFWKANKENRSKTTPALLVYADLLSSGFERNIQIANQIFNNELQHIK